MGRSRTPLDSKYFSSSSKAQADVTLTVDGKEVTVPQGLLNIMNDVDMHAELRVSAGTALIQACEAAGANVPR